MKHILCFGDSNTHGFIPGGGRYADDVRWTGVLTNLLGKDYKVMEEGLNGRTSSFDDPLEPYKNGMDYIIPCINTHKPLDLTILMLGSNDMKNRMEPSVEKITDSIRRLTQVILEVSEAPVLIVSPILLGKEIENSVFACSFNQESVQISYQLADAFEKVAKDLDVYFLNAADFAKPSQADCLHLTAEGHAALGKAFYEKIMEIL